MGIRKTLTEGLKRRTKERLGMKPDASLKEGVSSAVMGLVFLVRTRLEDLLDFGDSFSTDDPEMAEAIQSGCFSMQRGGLPYEGLPVVPRGGREETSQAGFPSIGLVPSRPAGAREQDAIYTVDVGSFRDEIHA